MIISLKPLYTTRSAMENATSIKQIHFHLSYPRVNQPKSSEVWQEDYRPVQHHFKLPAAGVMA